MLGTLARIIGGLLVGWMLFIAAAMGFAWVKRRTVAPADPADDEVDLVANFGPLDFASTATAFRGGRVDTWFGGGILDLRGATLDPAGATLEVNAMFGGGNLVVPADWNVELRVSGLGGASDNRTWFARSPEAPSIRVEGIALFGGWAVSSTRPDDEANEAPALAPV